MSVTSGRSVLCLAFSGDNASIPTSEQSDTRGAEPRRNDKGTVVEGRSVLASVGQSMIAQFGSGVISSTTTIFIVLPNQQWLVKRPFEHRTVMTPDLAEPRARMTEQTSPF